MICNFAHDEDNTVTRATRKSAHDYYLLVLQHAALVFFVGKCLIHFKNNKSHGKHQEMSKITGDTYGRPVVTGQSIPPKPYYTRIKISPT